MLDTLRQRYRAFRAHPAGERFQHRYRRRACRGGGAVRKLLTIVAALALIVAGIVLLVLPGPGLLLILLGAGLIAEESLLAARMLDRTDLAISRPTRR